MMSMVWMVEYIQHCSTNVIDVHNPKPLHLKGLLIRWNNVRSITYNPNNPNSYQQSPDQMESKEVSLVRIVKSVEARHEFFENWFETNISTEKVAIVGFWVLDAGLVSVLETWNFQKFLELNFWLNAWWKFWCKPALRGRLCMIIAMRNVRLHSCLKLLLKFLHQLCECSHEELSQQESELRVYLNACNAIGAYR